MIKRAAKTQKLVSIIHDHGFQASLKIRLGTNAHEKEQKVYLNPLRGVDADFFIVHVKTAAQESTERDDYSVFPECVEAAGGRPVIANGGIDSAKKVRHLSRMGVAGVMIGRAALRNPTIFDELRNELRFNDPKKIMPSLDELREEYEGIHTQLGGNERYRIDFLRVLGRRIGSERY
jgi:tRNA-dihydrouridine synthase